MLKTDPRKKESAKRNRRWTALIEQSPPVLPGGRIAC